MEGATPASRSGVPDVRSTPVGETVRSIAAGRPVHWIPNPGNAGDALITAATAHFFRSHGIDFRPVPDAEALEAEGKIVCYGGGGNLIPLYHHAREAAARYHARAEHFLILPHTIDGNDSLLAAFGPNVTVFCREAVSYRYCLAAAPNARVLAGDDMAFSMNLASLMRPPVSSGDRSAAEDYRRAQRKFVEFLAEAGEHEELSVFRADKEKKPGRPLPDSPDISLLYQPPRQTFQHHLVAAHFFLCTVDAFSSVRTDRLHVAIAGALLGKRVTLYANSYYKNRAVYDFSLRRLPNVEFVE